MEEGYSFRPAFMAFGIFFALICIYVARVWYYGRNTVPVPTYISGFKNPKEVKETFYGGAAKGTGSPDCLRSSSEGAELIGMLEAFGKVEKTAHACDDMRELTQIVGKLSCLKHDLTSTAYIIDSTKSQQFITSHDMEPLAETAGRCFSKTIPPRDLELAFDKWSSRGETLIGRLTIKYKLSESESQKANTLFNALVRDVKDIARGTCLQGEPLIAGKVGPRDPHPFDEPKNVELGSYTGYY